MLLKLTKEQQNWVESILNSMGMKQLIEHLLCPENCKYSKQDWLDMFAKVPFGSIFLDKGNSEEMKGFFNFHCYHWIAIYEDFVGLHRRIIKAHGFENRAIFVMENGSKYENFKLNTSFMRKPGSCAQTWEQEHYSARFIQRFFSRCDASILMRILFSTFRLIMRKMSKRHIFFTLGKIRITDEFKRLV